MQLRYTYVVPATAVVVASVEEEVAEEEAAEEEAAEDEIAVEEADERRLAGIQLLFEPCTTVI